MNSLKKLYSAGQTPYMGDINEAIGGCPASMGPKTEEIKFLGAKVTALIGAAGDGHAFGACSRAQAKFSGAYWGHFDAKSKKLWLVRFFNEWKSGPLRSAIAGLISAQFHQP